jgi:hypothetical protein
LYHKTRRKLRPTSAATTPQSDREPPGIHRRVRQWPECCCVIFGQEGVVEQALITVLSGSHALLIPLEPGLAPRSSRGALGE